MDGYATMHSGAVLFQCSRYDQLITVGVVMRFV